MSEAYTKAPNQSNENRSYDGSDSMGLNNLYALTARKESNVFQDYINPTDDGQLDFHSGSLKTNFDTPVIF